MSANIDFKCLKLAGSPRLVRSPLATIKAGFGSIYLMICNVFCNVSLVSEYRCESGSVGCPICKSVKWMNRTSFIVRTPLDIRQNQEIENFSHDLGTSDWQHVLLLSISKTSLFAGEIWIVRQVESTTTALSKALCRDKISLASKTLLAIKTFLASKTLLDEIARYEFAHQIGFNTQINF